MDNEKELRERYVSYVNKHNLSPTSLKIYRIIFLILAIIALFIGLPTLTFSLAGLFFIIIGLFFIYLAKTYKKIYNTLYKTPASENRQQPAEIKTDIPTSNTDIVAPTETSTEKAASNGGNNNDCNLETTTIAPALQNDTVTTTKISAKGTTPIDNNYKFEQHYIAGTSFREDNIESLAYENPDYSLKKRDFMDIYAEEERAYQYSFAPQSVELIEEPDNPHDPNAIKVVIDDVHVGYIKAGSCSHIKKLLHSNSIVSISAEIYGGKFRYYYEDYDDDAMDYKSHMKTERHNYSVCITLKIKKN